MRYLRQSTSVDVSVGPFLDTADGFTPKTALTITQPDILLKKNGGAIAQKNAAQTLSHESIGYYEVTLDATDTNTLGILRVMINESGALPVWEDFMVLPANAYDSLVAGSDTFDVQVTGMGASVLTASAIAADAITDAKVAADVTIASVTGAVGSVTAGVTVTTNNDKTGYGLSGAAVQAIWDALTSALTTANSIGKKLADWVIGTTQTGDAFVRLGAPVGASISADIAAVKTQTAAIEADTTVIGAAGAGLTALPWNAAWDAEVQSEVQDALEANHLDRLLAVTYDPASKPGAADALLNELVESNAGVARFTANALEQAPSGGGSLTLADIADAVWDEAIAGHLAAGTTGLALNSAGAAGDPWSTTLPGAYGAGSAGKLLSDNLDATVSSRASQTSVNTVDDLLDTEIASISAAITVVDDLLDTEIAAIKAKTDLIPASPAAVGSAMTLADGAITAAKIAADAITAAKVAADAVTEIQSGLATAAALGVVDDLLDTEVAAIKLNTDKIGTAMELDGAVYRFTTNALEMGPSGSGSGATVAEVEEIISRVPVFSSSPVRPGNLHVYLVKGDTYTTALGRALIWDVSAFGLNLTGATANMICSKFTKACTINTTTDVITCELLPAQTNLLVDNEIYEYTLVITISGGALVTPVVAKIYVE
jgi:hypothetical protein